MSQCNEPLTYSETEALARLIIEDAESLSERNRQEHSDVPASMLGIVF